MKKILNICVILIIALVFRLNVDALSSSITVNNTSIEKGNSVKATVTVSGAAAWTV